MRALLDTVGSVDSDVLAHVHRGMARDLKSFLRAFSGFYRDGLAALANILDSAFGSMNGLVTNIVDRMRDLVSALGRAMNDHMPAFLANEVGGVRDGLRAIRGGLPGVLHDVLGAVRSLHGDGLRPCVHF